VLARRSNRRRPVARPTSPWTNTSPSVISGGISLNDGQSLLNQLAASAAAASAPSLVSHTLIEASTLSPASSR